MNEIKERMVEDKIRIGKTKKEIPLKFLPKDWMTNIQDDGSDLVRPLAPNFVRNIQTGRVDAALRSLGIETMIAARNESAIQVEGFEAPMAVSANVPPGCFMIDGRDRIVVNERWAEHRAIDADGDRGMIVFGKDQKTAILVKFPITKVVPILTRVYRKDVVESFYDLCQHPRTYTTKDGDFTTPKLSNWYNINKPFRYCSEKNDFSLPDTFKDSDLDTAPSYVMRDGKKYTAFDERKMFFKSHTVQEIGILTSAWNTYELFASLGKSWQHAFGRIVFHNETRYEQIEGSIKSSRKDLVEKMAINIMDTFRKKLKPYIAPFLTSSGGIVKATDQDALSFTKLNYRSVLKRVESCLLVADDFIDIPQPRNAAVVTETIVDYQMIYRLCGFYFENGERKTNKHLRQRLAVLQYQHHDKKFPYNPSDPFDLTCLPVIVLLLVDANGQVCGLTDVKRDDGRAQGLTYMYMIPPCWDHDEKRFMHPIEKLNKDFQTQIAFDENGQPYCTSRFDSRITNPDGDTVTLFGSNTDSRGRFQDDFAKYGQVKGVNLQRLITEWCGEFGFPIDGEKKNGQLVPYPLAYHTITKMVTCDYGKPCDASEMWKRIKIANRVTRLCMSGNKQQNQRVRKYALAHANGVAIWASPKAHAARSGKISSQLAKGLKVCRMKCAVLEMDTQTQVYITPSGIVKQHTDKAYLPQTFSTKEKYDKWCEKNNLDPEDTSLYYRTVHTSWATGEQRVSYVTTPKSSIEIGKLIDPNGMKFMPRRMPQAYDSRGNNLDLLIPIMEIQNKGALHALLGDELPKTEEITITHEDGSVQNVYAVVVDLVFYRSGSSSENVPTRHRKATYHGCDAHAISYAYSVMMADGELVERKCWKTPDFTVIDEYQRIARILERWETLPDTFVEVEETELVDVR